MLTDDDGRFMYVCPNVDVIFGFSRDEVAAIGCVDGLLGSALFDRATLADSGELRNVEREVTIKSGHKRVVLIHVKTVAIQGATVLYCCRDVTELRRAEEEVRALRLELAHVARLALAGQLVASIAHEVKQPLTAIVGNATAAAAALGDSPDFPHASELREILADIAAEGRLAADVIDRLRKLSRKRPLALAPVDVNEIVAETSRFVAGDARRHHVTLHTELERPLPPVRADRVCVLQVLMVLTLNAMDAMDEVGPQDRRIVLCTRRTEAGVLLSVSDTGPGIPAPVFGKLFEPFFTTKSHGLGLGLAIARSLVAAHNGRIWAANGDGRGATFHVSLPEAEHSAA